MNLNIKDILNVCQTNKKCNEICKNKNFWENKILNDFGKINYDKPNDFSYLEWYKILSKSGDLIQLGINDIDTGYVNEHIYKCFQFQDNQSYYIDVSNNLWKFDASKVTHALYINKIMNNVQDLFIGNKNLYLLTDGSLVDDDGTQIQKNIKSISYNPLIKNKCLFINNKDELYLLTIKKNGINKQHIDYNVKNAKIQYEQDIHIYYITDDNDLHVQSGYTILSHPNGILEYQDTNLIHKVMIFNNVNDIAFVGKYMYVLDINHKLWLYEVDYSKDIPMITNYKPEKVWTKKIKQISTTDIKGIYDILILDIDNELIGLNIDGFHKIIDNNVYYINNGLRVLYIKAPESE